MRKDLPSGESGNGKRLGYINELQELAERRCNLPRRQVVRNRSRGRGIKAEFPWPVVLVSIAVIATAAIIATVIARS
jgi:hypothetical protein